MFRKCLSYYRKFHANNKLSSRTFASWQNSPIKFGSKFTRIQQNGNAKYNILFQPQQFQRYQFCSGNFDNDAPSLLNDITILWLGNYRRKNVKLETKEGKSGQKFFKIAFYIFGEFKNFSNILIPQDAYSFVRALDELIMELSADNFEQKLQIQDPTLSIEIANDGHETSQLLKLKTVEIDSLRHKFQLELWLNTKADKKDIFLRFKSVNKITNQKRTMDLPLQALPWLRKQMVERLILHDGTEQITLEAPAQIPQQFFRKVESTNGRNAGIINSEDSFQF